MGACKDAPHGRNDRNGVLEAEAARRNDLRMSEQSLQS